MQLDRKSAMNADLVFDAYVECALWSSTDESTPSGGYPLDRNYSREDIDADALKAMRAEVDDFLAHLPAGTDEFDDGQLGHDFWLTRNRHGAGFWDGDWPEKLGRELTDRAHGYGDAGLYVGDDGRIYFFNG